jgi:polar amino acid transport system substrate-binding protein
MGTDLTYKPYEYMDDSGNPAGYDFEIWQNIAKDLGVELKYQDLAFAGIFTGLETGKYDVAGCNCMINTERAKKYDFCRPVYSSKYTIVKLASDDSIQSVEDLKGKKVGAQLGSSTQQAVEKYDNVLKTKLGSGIGEIKHYNLSTDAFLDLTNGNIDAVCENNSICDQQVSQSDGKFKIVGTILDPVYISFAFRKTDTELRDYVNSEIDKFKKDGTLYTLQKKYFGFEIKDLPDDESQYIPQ